MIPFSLLWGGFAVFWEVTAYSNSAPPFFLLFGGAFVLVGFYFVVGSFFWDSATRESTFYGLTNERVLILKEFPLKSRS